MDRADRGGRAAPARPLLDLAPVVLPAPGGGFQGARSVRRRALVLTALLAGAVLLPVVVVLVLAALAAWLTQQAAAGIYLAFAPIVVGVALGRGLIAAVQRPPQTCDETEVPRTAEPGLHAEVEGLAAAAGTRPPDRIVLDGSVSASVREEGIFFGVIGARRTLTIGAPLLDVLDVSELRAVLAHELGHFAGGDTRLGWISYGTNAIIAHLTYPLGRRGGALFAWYARAAWRVSATDRRAQELVADRAAVRVAGRQAAADALRDIDVADRALCTFRTRYLRPLLEAGFRPDDLVEGWRSFLLVPGQVARMAATPDESDGPVDPFSSHPSTADRIRNIAELADEASVGRDRRPAASLFTDADGWARKATERWLLAHGGGARVPRLGWDRFAEVVTGAGYEERAQVLDRTLAGLGLPAGLDGLAVAAAADRVAEVTDALLASGWNVAGDAQPLLWRVAVAAAVAGRAVAGGARWTTSWSSPGTLRSPSGGEIALWTLTDAAVAGDWDRPAAELASISR